MFGWYATYGGAANVLAFFQVDDFFEFALKSIAILIGPNGRYTLRVFAKKPRFAKPFESFLEGPSLQHIDDTYVIEARTYNYFGLEESSDGLL